MQCAALRGKMHLCYCCVLVVGTSQCIGVDSAYPSELAVCSFHAASCQRSADMLVLLSVR
jgi:hypothetical protein